MFNNYLKTALRNIWKTKLSSFINVFGLSLGIACSILIVLFVKDEWTFDTFHRKSDRIYRPWTETERRNGEISQNVATPFILGSTLKEHFEEIEDYTSFNVFNEQVIRGDQAFNEFVNLVSPGFFNIFDYEVLKGSIDGVLSDPSNIVITEGMQEKYFGKDDPINQTLKIRVGEEEKDFVVRAVIIDTPSNSSIQFSFVISDENAKLLFPEQMLTGWFMISGETYVTLKEGVSSTDLEQKFPSMVRELLGERLGDRMYAIHLQPITDIHLNTDMPPGFAPVSDPMYTFILVGVALLVLALACINFVVLSLSRSITRAREIGVRKVVGASKGQLVQQFLSEATLLAFLSLVMGICIAYFTLPLFNELAGKRLTIEIDPFNLGIFMALALLVGLISGIYPALVLSGFRPVKILKGVIDVGTGKQYIKKIMVTGQFVLSIFLVTCTLIMHRQLTYIQNKNLGFDQDQIITVPLNVYGARGLRQSINLGMQKSQNFKNEIATNVNVLDVSASSQEFGRGNWIQISFIDQEDNAHNFFTNIVDYNYGKTLGLEILQGRDFSKNSSADERRGILVNEAFIRHFNLENPIGERIPHEAFTDHEIIGVVKDFNFASLHTAIEPLVLSMNHEIPFSGATGISINSSVTPKLFLKIKAGEIPETLTQIENTWNLVYPEEPFTYDFIDETLKAQYVQEKNLEKIISTSTILAILISALGLFALATLAMRSKVKEISIRKVLGAPMKHIIILFTKGYVTMIVIALIVTVPFTYYAMNKWLDTFEFKITIGPDHFLIGGLISLGVAILTIVYHSLKLAMTNPVNGLKED
ncbi:ABC transporter permease [Fulvivirgaceae bacterium BMA10]|uniref:ABC transporter permease n=1 Tax=Splendidivirga corallicola TaxID=3051826 RepID=A0ABT8KRR5_9BACT|nr:ABC transporter permease [Fulvivirgaceae bacterium BMA10]